MKPNEKDMGWFSADLKRNKIMDRFNSNEELEATPLSIAKDIIYSEGTMDEKVKQIESAITEAEKLAISDVRLSFPSDSDIEEASWKQSKDELNQKFFQTGALWMRNRVKCNEA